MDFEKLIDQFIKIDSEEKWYLWVNEVNAIPDEQIARLFDKIGRKEVSKTRNKYSVK